MCDFRSGDAVVLAAEDLSAVGHKYAVAVANDSAALLATTDGSEAGLETAHRRVSSRRSTGGGASALAASDHLARSPPADGAGAMSVHFGDADVTPVDPREVTGPAHEVIGPAHEVTGPAHEIVVVHSSSGSDPVPVVTHAGEAPAGPAHVDTRESGHPIDPVTAV